MGKIFIGNKIIPENPVTEFIKCCSCQKYYNFEGNIFLSIKGKILVCPHCGLKHKVDFTLINNIYDLVKINKLDLVAIDIGTAAITSLIDYSVKTLVNGVNPANATGKITSVEIYPKFNLTGCEVATFSAIGNNLTTRDHEAIGNVAAGYNQFDVSLNVEAGDYLGIYFSGGNLRGDTSEARGTVWYLNGDNIPCTNTTFNAYSDSNLSLYGTGVTLPAQVIGVSATDGTYTDKVRITWSAATGATGYDVWTGSSWVDVGNVLTYDHTTAPAPTITVGTASASDGTSADYVTLSVASESVNNGSSISYKVRAYNAAGDGAESAVNTGYRGHGTLTYQWQRSAADSDASYSNIDGATTDPYNDTGAPEDGSGRYFKCVENATGASQQITNSDRGYRKLIKYLISTAAIAISTTGILSRGLKEALSSTANITSSITSSLSRGITQTLFSNVNIVTSITGILTKAKILLNSTSVITTSMTSSLSRGIKEALTSTSDIATSITGRLTRIVNLASASAITTSITSSLSRGIKQALTSTSAITISITSYLNRGIKEALNTTVNITTSTVSTLSRGITQSLASTANIVLSIVSTLTAKYLFIWIKVKKEITDFTKIEKEESDPTKIEKEKSNWTKIDKEKGD